jgi:hypothetical protein
MQIKCFRNECGVTRPLYFLAIDEETFLLSVDISKKELFGLAHLQPYPPIVQQFPGPMSLIMSMHECGDIHGVFAYQSQRGGEDGGAKPE